MVIVTSDFLAAMLTNYKVIFNKALSENLPGVDDWQKIATRIDSNSDKETLGWLGSTKIPTKWKDKRQVHGLNQWNYTLTNEDYEDTIGVDRNTYEDDKFKMIAPRIAGMANAYRRLYNKLVFSLLDDGETYLAYDGGAFFKTDRTIKSSGTINNLLSGNYSDSSAEIIAGISAAAAAMAGFKDDWGEPIGLMPDTVVCAQAMALPLANALIPSVAGTTRPEMAYVKNIIVNPWIDADTDDWFVLCTTLEIKPLVLQIRKEPEFVGKDNPQDEHVFMNKEFLYGVDGRCVGGYGEPRCAVLLHNT